MDFMSYPATCCMFLLAAELYPRIPETFAFCLPFGVELLVQHLFYVLASLNIHEKGQNVVIIFHSFSLFLYLQRKVERQKMSDCLGKCVLKDAPEKGSKVNLGMKRIKFTSALKIFEILLNMNED